MDLDISFVNKYIDIHMLNNMLKYVFNNLNSSIEEKYLLNKIKCYIKKCKRDNKLKCQLKLLKYVIELHSKLSNNNNKICFLLSSTFSEDNKIAGNLKYLGLNYPLFFDVTIEKLDELYKNNYRIFIGPNTSSALTQFLQWFTDHPDTICISLTSSSPSLNNRMIKNIYRLTPPDNLVIDVYIQFIKFRNYRHIHLLLEEGDTFSEALTLSLHNSLQPLVGTIIDSVNIISTNISNTDEVVQQIDIGPEHLSVVSLVEQNLIDTFVNSLSNSSKQANYIDNVSSTPKELPNDIINIYYFIGYEPTYERNVQKLIDDLGISNVSTTLIDAINMAQSFKINNNYDNVIGSYGYLYFDSVNDRSTVYFTIRLFNGFSWEPVIAYQIHPTLGFSEVLPIN